MTKLLLHIGTHKTGTTAIQSFLEANAQALDAHGVYYPLFDVRWPQLVFKSRNGYFLNRAALRSIGEEMRADDRAQIDACRVQFENLIDELGSGAVVAPQPDTATRAGATVRRVSTAQPAADAQVDDSQADGRPSARSAAQTPAQEPTILLSDERMWYSGALHKGYWEAVRKIALDLGIDQIQVILYLRRQDEFAESLWNQFVKATKKTESLEDYLAGNGCKAACDYYEGVKRLERVFGKENVRLAVYDRGKLKNGDAVDDFCYRIGLPLGEGFVRPAKREENTRLNNNLVEVKRIMNRSAEYQYVNNIYGRAFANAMQADDWTPRTTMISDEQRRAFMERFKKGNKLLAKEYFGDSQMFAPLKPSESPTWEVDVEGMLRDTVYVMADMLAAQERRIRALEAHLGQLEQGGRGGKRR